MKKAMKYLVIVHAIIIVILSSCTTGINIVDNTNTKTCEKNNNILSSVIIDYKLHGPIIISSDNDFIEENGVTFGDGTKNNPYIIESWNITGVSGYLIKITNTNKFFIIRNCYLYIQENYGINHETSAVYFSKVVNATIDNNIIKNTAIYLVNSNDSYISNNHLGNIGHSDNCKIFIDGDNNLIKNNYIENGIGFEIRGEYAEVTFNTAKYCSLGISLSGNYGKCTNNILESNLNGMAIAGPSYYVLVANNTIKNRKIGSNGYTIGYGIGMCAGQSNIIENNLVDTTWGYGIWCYGCDPEGIPGRNNIIRYNTVKNISYYTSYNTLNYCIFLEFEMKDGLHHNNIMGSAQTFGYEDVSGIVFYYEKHGNYWYDYHGEDKDVDGIGDTPYQIASSNYMDDYPFMHPIGYNPDRPYPPIITGPSSGKVNRNHEFTFTASDTDGSDVWYYIEWGDGTNTGWLGPYDSGTVITQSHKWTEQADFSVRAKAKNEEGEESEWSNYHVTMPKNRISNNILLQKFFERFQNAFPILRKLIGLT